MVMIDPNAVDAQRRRSRRRMLQMLIAGLAVIGVVGLTAVPAAAAQRCGPKGNSTICLAIDSNGDGTFRVSVGIDVHMSLAQAQEYVDDPWDPFRVTIFGDDGGGTDQERFDVPLRNLGVSSEFGLSGDFNRDVPGSWLNEDPPGQEDEIVARVQLIDTDTNRIDATYVSFQLSGNWP
jgi:hypothetical protein